MNNENSLYSVSVQFNCSVMSDSVTPWTAAHQTSLSITNSSLLKLLFIESVIPSNRFILFRPLLLLPSSFPSIRVFSSESALHIRWPKYCNFSFRITPSNEYSGLLSFRVDWFDLLAGDSQESSPTPQFKSINSLVLSFLYGLTLTFIHDYWKNHAFVGKIMSLLFHMLSRLAIAFLPRCKCHLISWLQSPSAMILKHKKMKSVNVSIVSPSICHEVMEPDAMILVF